MGIYTNTKERLGKMWRSYRTAIAFRDLFKTPDGELSNDAEIVLKTLAKFCNVESTSIRYGLSQVIDPYQVAVNEGRRQVYLMMLKKINVKDEQINDFFEREVSDG